MNKKIERNYLEINSFEDFNDSKLHPEGFIVQLLNPVDFQINK